MKLKTICVRVALVWFLIAQMLFVCLPAHTTRPLSRLESLYAFKPSPANRVALDNEFERTARFETERALWRFVAVLAADVLLIALCKHWRVIGRSLFRVFPIKISQVPPLEPEQCGSRRAAM